MSSTEEREGRIEKALTELVQLRKHDDLDANTQERVRKANRELQAEYLASVSPSAFAAWQASRDDRY